MRGEVDADRRELLVAALAAGCNVAEAARRSGYKRPYVHRLLRAHPEIQEEAKRRAASLEGDGAKTRLQNALQVLEEVSQDQDAATRDRLTAAKALVQFFGPACAKRVPSPAAPVQGDEPEPEGQAELVRLRLLDPTDPAARAAADSLLDELG